tara:strand:- start:12404 stop:12760 length:357 start_codon:yes stop_codon:yes gene_type:complete
MEELTDYNGIVFEGLKQYGPDLSEGKTLIIVQSHHSGKHHTHQLDIPHDVFKARIEESEKLKEKRVFIQDIFPELTDSQREALMTGISSKEWDDIFPEGDQYDMETKEGVTFGERKMV